MLQAALRDAQALVIPGEGHPALMTTPAAPPFARAERFEVKGALDGAGTFTAHIDVSLRGDVALTLKTSFRQTPPAKWLELAQIISYSSGFVGAVSNLDVQDLDNTEKPLHFSYDYVRKDYPDWANLQVAAPLPPILFPYGDNGEAPSEPIELGMPGELVYRASVRLPAGYSGKVPENATSDAEFAAYNAAYSFVSGVISAERRVVFKQPRVPVSA
jgi:hypothetical protein